MAGAIKVIFSFSQIIDSFTYVLGSQQNQDWIQNMNWSTEVFSRIYPPISREFLRQFDGYLWHGFDFFG